MHIIDKNLKRASFTHEPLYVKVPDFYVKGSNSHTKIVPDRCKHCGQKWSDGMFVVGCYKRAENLLKQAQVY